MKIEIIYDSEFSSELVVICATEVCSVHKELCAWGKI